MNKKGDKGIADSIFKIKANKSFKRMLDCLLNQDSRRCKVCKDINVCCLLTQAVFAYKFKCME